MDPKDSFRPKFKEMNILTIASHYIYENAIYIKKNINDSTKIGDEHNINKRNNLEHL